MADTKISKNEAVRLAILELGKEAGRVEIQKHVKERFGFDLTLNHVSAARVAALRKLGATPGPQAASAPATRAEAKNGARAAARTPPEGEKITKKEAVRRALATLGKKAKPTAIKGWIKDNLAIEMTTDHISTAKGELLRKGKKKPTPSPAPKVQAAAVTRAVKAANGKGVLLEDILTLKDLVKRIGAEHLRTLIDVMSK
jgi:hypothetical protein